MHIQNECLAEFSKLVQTGTCGSRSGRLKTGVDLGTANIVLAVVDENNIPVTGIYAPSKVVKDGVVVDYFGAIKVIKQLKEILEERLGERLLDGAVAIPPGILESTARSIANVAEGAGFEVTNVVDEPTAAAKVLGVMDGAVVDVGGGTTGISILRDGNVIFTADEPTGGIHMTLTLAGYYGVTLEEAETIKKDISREDEIFPVIKPVVQKMASIVKRFLTGYDVEKIYVVGGSSCFCGFEDVFEKEIGIETIKPNDALLVTPLGIAWSVL